MKRCFLVVSKEGYWARGATLLEAAQKCQGSKSAETNAFFINGDDEASFDGFYFHYAQGAERVDIGYGFKLGQLQKLRHV